MLYRRFAEVANIRRYLPSVQRAMRSVSSHAAEGSSFLLRCPEGVVCTGLISALVKGNGKPGRI